MIKAEVPGVLKKKYHLKKDSEKNIFNFLAYVTPRVRSQGFPHFFLAYSVQSFGQLTYIHSTYKQTNILDNDDTTTVNSGSFLSRFDQLEEVVQYNYRLYKGYRKSSLNERSPSIEIYLHPAINNIFFVTEIKSDKN